MHDFRQKFVEKLKDFLQNDNFIYCVWEGGSAATGYLDDYSDLDLCLICADDQVDNSFQKMHDYFAENYGIRKEYRLPEPNWHGHSQRFYLLENTPEFFYLDVLIEKLSAGNRFMESDRHGNGLVWFDKKSLFDPTPTPFDEINAKAKRYYRSMRDSSWVIFLEVKKQIFRENIVDAAATYQQVLHRLVILWNLKYRPAKCDFGLRYTYRDFPPEICNWLEKKMLVTDLNQMQKNVSEIEQKFEELIAELADKWS